MTTDTTPTAPTSAPHQSDEVAAHVVDSIFRVAVVDAGEKRLRYNWNHTLVRRDGWEARFDRKTDTVTVFRDSEKSILGHKPLPAFPPLTEGQVQRIANEIRNRGLEGELDSKPFCFYDDSDALEVYLDEVAAAIEHPAWCQRVDCWDRSPLSMVEHTRTAGSHTWKSVDGDTFKADASLRLYAEEVSPQTDETPVVEVKIGPEDVQDFLVFDGPDDLRKLGQYLITAADDLEWEKDDA